MSPSSPFRKLTVIAITLTIGVISSAALIPTVISTRYGTEKLSQVLSHKMNCSLQIQSLSLSWFGSQNIYGISYSDNGESFFASCESITSTASLWQIVTGLTYGDVAVLAPHMKIKKELHRPVKASPVVIQQGAMLLIPSLQELIPLTLSRACGTLKITAGLIDLMPPEIDPISIYNIDSLITLSDPKNECSISLHASTAQNTQQGSISLEGAVTDLLSTTITCVIEGSIMNLPVKAIDQISTLFAPQWKGALEEMLGETLSMNLSGSLSQKNATLDLQATSPNLKVSFKSLSDGQCITVKQPAHLECSLSPALLDRFTPLLKHLQLNPIAITGTIVDLSIPIHENGIDWKALDINAKITAEALQIKSLSGIDYQTGPMTFSASRKAIENTTKLSFSCPIKAKDLTSQIYIEGTSQIGFSDTCYSDITCQLIDLPTALLDKLAGSSLATSVLGEHVNGKARLTLTEAHGPWQLILSTQTPTLSIDQAQFLLGATLKIKDPFTLKIKPSILLVDKLLSNTDITLASLPETQINITKMTIPASFNLEQLQLDAVLHIPQLQLQHQQARDPYILNHVVSSLSIETFKRMHLKIESDLVNIHLAGAYDQNRSTFQLQDSCQITYLLTDGQIGRFFKEKKRLYLTHPSTVSIAIKPTEIWLDKDLLSKMQMEASISAKELVLQNLDGSCRATLDNTEMHIDFTGPSDSMKLQVNTTLIDQEGSRSTLRGQIATQEILHHHLTDTQALFFSSDIYVDNMPTQVLQLLDKDSSRLQYIIGPKLNLQAHIETNSLHKAFTIDLLSDNVQVKGSLLLENGLMSITGAPMKGSLQITPESYLEIDRILTQQDTLSSYKLTKNSIFSFELSELHIPMNKSQDSVIDSLLHLTMQEAYIKGHIANPSLHLSNPSNQKAIYLKNMSVLIEKSPANSPLMLNLSTEALSGSGKLAEQSGTMDIKAKLSDLLQKDGHMDLSKLFTSVVVQIHRIPSPVFDFFARSFGDCSSSFSAIFGPTMTAEVNMELQNTSGPLRINVNSPSTRASLNGKIEQGTLRLTEPIYAQVSMTPDLSRFVLGGVNPLSITEIRSQHPITLEIQPEGFSLPLTDFTLSKVNIPNARIELGQIACNNEGNLNIALSLLKSVQLSQNNQLALWFSPIDLHIHQGVFDVERTEILIAETFDIAVWGAIQPIKNTVDMVLGLTSNCLAKAFSINNLPQDYVLHIPMTGTLNDVKINTGKATTKVAALLALQQADVAGGLAGGPAGALFGKFINKLGSLPLNDKKTPAAKHPFPWESGITKKKPAPSSIEPKKRRAHIKEKDKPLKQALKVIR